MRSSIGIFFGTETGTTRLVAKKIPVRLGDALRRRHDVCVNLGAKMVGAWHTQGDSFERSAAVLDGRFVGLVIDQRTQGMHTEARLDAWAAQVKPQLLAPQHG